MRYLECRRHLAAAHARTMAGPWEDRQRFACGAECAALARKVIRFRGGGFEQCGACRLTVECHRHRLVVLIHELHERGDDAPLRLSRHAFINQQLAGVIEECRAPGRELDVRNRTALAEVEELCRRRPRYQIKSADPGAW